jgi:serine/threonine protein kinase
MQADKSRFGEFIIDGDLGEGGMGRVFRARQISLDRPVALKILSDKSPDVSTRFHREARSAARLVHPNIVQVYTVGCHQGTPYFAMEYIEGMDLDKILRYSGSLEIPEAIEVVRAIARALVAASQHGIVHRDIKPANVMISKTGQIKVMDFGLAKGLSSNSAALTQPGLVLGTPTYMAPEQGAGEEVDVRADMYSLGCVMYHCLCGRPPFDAQNVATLLYKHMYQTPANPSELVPGITPDIETICMTLLAKKRDERYATAQQVLDAINALQVDCSQAESTLARISEEALQISTVKPPPAGSTKDPLPHESTRVEKWARHLLPVRQKSMGNFQLLDDNRWSYKSQLAHCEHAEGLAAELRPGNAQSTGNLGDCLLCTNWNRRFGCALAYCQELANEGRKKGIALASEQAIAWSGAGRFDRAIEILENFLKDNPDEPEAYREMARLYEHPDYRGNDRRRAVVLYQRFADLAYASRKYPAHEIMRTEERIRVLMSLNDTRAPIAKVPEGISFNCFFETDDQWYCQGLLTPDALCLAKAGCIDPESGESAPESGGTFKRASRFLRRITRQIRKETPASVRAELTRLAALPLPDLSADPACVLHFSVTEISRIDWKNTANKNVKCLGLYAPKCHELIFTKSCSFKAEQIHELLRRSLLLRRAQAC